MLFSITFRNAPADIRVIVTIFFIASDQRSLFITLTIILLLLKNHFSDILASHVGDIQLIIFYFADILRVWLMLKIMWVVHGIEILAIGSTIEENWLLIDMAIIAGKHIIILTIFI